jgi:hypothetical protein
LRVYYGLDFSLWQVEQAEVSGTRVMAKNKNGRDKSQRKEKKKTGKARMYRRNRETEG